jgi:hypothetical protein
MAKVRVAWQCILIQCRKFNSALYCESLWGYWTRMAMFWSGRPVESRNDAMKSLDMLSNFGLAHGVTQSRSGVICHGPNTQALFSGRYGKKQRCGGLLRSMPI